jgi:hypothetical protein
LGEGEDEPDEDEDDGRGGDCESEVESAWMAFSTFLNILLHAKKRQGASVRTSRTLLV